jgi:hypothetical protein
MSAWLDDSWLQFDAIVPAAGKSARCLMERNAQINGPAKLALLPDGPRPHIRAELPIDDEIDSPLRIPEVCAAFAHAKALLSRDRSNQHAPVTSPSEGLAHDMAEICRESGWDSQQRSPDELCVDLEIPDGFIQAMITSTDSGQVRLSAGIVDQEFTSDVGCEALAVMLARACGCFRMIRAVLEADPEHVSARFELLFGSVPAAHEVSEALSAMSVAARLCAEEARTLVRDEVVSRAYLVRHGYAPRPHRERRKHRPTGAQAPTAMDQLALNARST